MILKNCFYQYRRIHIIRRLPLAWGQESCLFFGTGIILLYRECIFTNVNNMLHFFCVVYPSHRNAKHTAIFFPLLCDRTMRDKVLQKGVRDNRESFQNLEGHQ